MKVHTDLGYFVLKAWVTEAIKPGVVACSHHMGRWRLHDEGQRQVTATVSLDRSGNEWSMRRTGGGGPYDSEDADSSRIWWADVGVNQNLTFPVHPDPISGMHCWHQAVRVQKADPWERAGDIRVDTTRSREIFREWLELTRSADEVSPDGTRRPGWFDRPVRPQPEAYRLPLSDAGEGTGST